MSHRTIGTCSICGGAVVTQDVWLGVVPPTPECSSCGAQPRRSHGPVIDMQPAPRVHIHSTGVAADGVLDEMGRVMEKQNLRRWPRRPLV